jgi:hypothetical protein
VVVSALWFATPVAQAQSGGSAPAVQPEVTIQAQRELPHRLRNFVRQISGPVTLQDDGDSMQLWRRPVCPLVGGLPQKDGQFVFDRLTDTLTSLGIVMGSVGCRPNFFILATTAYVDTPRPVRIWYNAELRSADGGGDQQLTQGVNTQFQGTPTYFAYPVSPRTEFAVVRELASVIAVIDLTRMGGMDWRQVTDYVAMHGLTNVRTDADVGDAPSILRLFSEPPADRLMALSDWDRAFVRAAYQTDRKSRRQRLRVWQIMVRDLKHP